MSDFANMSTQEILVEDGYYNKSSASYVDEMVYSDLLKLVGTDDFLKLDGTYTVYYDTDDGYVSVTQEQLKNVGDDYNMTPGQVADLIIDYFSTDWSSYGTA